MAAASPLSGISKVEFKRRFRSPCPVTCEVLELLRAENQISSLSSYFSAIDGVVKGDDLFWFRGHEETRWSLTPKALRPKTLAGRLKALDLIADFKRIAEAKLARVPEPDDAYKWVQIAQHYGLPTRLLDWTQSATVALYFACLKPKEDGLVFIFNPKGLNRQGTLSEARILDPEVDQKLIRSFLRVGAREPSRRSYPLAVNPIWSSERLIVQKGTFTLHGSLFSLDKARVPSLVAIPILREYKHKLRFELRRVGVDEMTLFPELEHSCRDLTMWSECGLLDFD
jgi:hypothetical protein